MAIRHTSIGPMWTTLPPPGTPVPLVPVEISVGLVGRGLGRGGELAPTPAVADPAEERPHQPEHAAHPLKRVRAGVCRAGLPRGSRRCPVPAQRRSRQVPPRTGPGRMGGSRPNGAATARGAIPRRGVPGPATWSGGGRRPRRPRPAPLRLWLFPSERQRADPGKAPVTGAIPQGPAFSPGAPAGKVQTPGPMNRPGRPLPGLRQRPRIGLGNGGRAGGAAGGDVLEPVRNAADRNAGSRAFTDTPVDTASLPEARCAPSSFPLS